MDLSMPVGQPSLVPYVFVALCLLQHLLSGSANQDRVIVIVLNGVMSLTEPERPNGRSEYVLVCTERKRSQFEEEGVVQVYIQLVDTQQKSGEFTIRGLQESVPWYIEQDEEATDVLMLRDGRLMSQRTLRCWINTRVKVFGLSPSQSAQDEMEATCARNDKTPEQIQIFIRPTQDHRNQHSHGSNWWSNTLQMFLHQIVGKREEYHASDMLEVDRWNSTYRWIPGFRIRGKRGWEEKKRERRNRQDREIEAATVAGNLRHHSHQRAPIIDIPEGRSPRRK
ncbi:hypothetical protein PROFUN_14986 [Planoprotostelium fungivorum]|uniref:Uncharacterized protein n=1 Tax=Planoprotostelium fungivorum TaxID=1890364 RepID=A0A2P6MY16_9EUKA|nr:hypothetical protein PROFUN_14986 [Planoprotostelium fungivorum]